MTYKLWASIRAVFLSAVLAIGGSFTITVGIAPMAPAQAAPTSPYCTVGSTYVDGYCVPAGGFGGGVCAHDDLIIGGASACGQASAPAFSAMMFSNMARTTSGLANDLVQQRIQCLLDPRLRACRKVKGKKRYSADLDDSDDEDEASGPSWGVWANGFGDYERDFTRQTLNAAAFGQGLTDSMTTSMGGAVVGADISLDGVLSPNDELVLGIQGTVEDSTSRMQTTRDHLSGGAIGIYGSYAFGAFTFETEDKVEFLHLHETFSDPLGASDIREAAGSFSTPNTNYDSDNSLAYRFNKDGPGWYVEPTIGLEFIRNTYDNAAVFGLQNGNTLQGRAGTYFGTKYVTTDQNLTIDSKFGIFGFSDLVSNGGSSLVVNLSNPVAPLVTDQGKLRAKFSADETFSFANGFSLETKAEYRVGSSLQGIGGELTLRYDF